MLARSIVDRRETRLDALQLCRIEIEATAIIAKRARRFVQLNRGWLNERDDLA